MSECNENDNGAGIRAELLELYTRLANAPHTDFGWSTGPGNARALGYADAWLDRLPACVWESAAAVGNPFQLGPIHAGETIVDIGCGAGADACVAALLVGDRGTVIGVDMTPAMLSRATRNAAAAGLAQVAFQQADMSALALPDQCADVAISNGAINLAADKTAVLREIHRVLRPGGRLQIADMVRDPSDQESGCHHSENSWADCVSGTLDPAMFLSMLQAAGFEHVALTQFTGYRTAPSTIGALIQAVKTL